MGKNKQLSINMISTILAFFINMTINFFLSPYIINSLGSDAYGYVTLANNFVNYASLITVALNSVAGRFITINIHQNKKQEVNKYFSSVLFSNYFIALIILVLGIPFSLNIDKFINIPSNLVTDVKMLFIFVILNFIVSIVGTTYAVATFATNRLDLSSIRNIIGNLIKVLILLVLFFNFKPKVFFVGLAGLIYSVYILYSNKYYTKILLPNIEVKKKNFSIKKTWELISSGIWNTITKLGQVMIDGLDLLISNLFINPIAMGQLAISKTLATVFSSLLVTASSVFQPQLTIYYAKNDIKALVKEIKFSMKLTGMCANIFLAGLIAFGMMFYKLWIPNENIKLVYILTLLTLQGVFVSGIVHPLFNIYTLTNKLKINSLTQILSGLLNVIIVFIALKTTNLGIYAVAGVSTTIAIIRNLTFTPIYSAYCLNIKKSTFYSTMIRYIITTFIMIIVFIGIKSLFAKVSWKNLFLGAIICGIIGCIINFIFLFNKKEKKALLNKIKTKIGVGK